MNTAIESFDRQIASIANRGMHVSQSVVLVAEDADDLQDEITAALAEADGNPQLQAELQAALVELDKISQDLPATSIVEQE